MFHISYPEESPEQFHFNKKGSQLLPNCEPFLHFVPPICVSLNYQFIINREIHPATQNMDFVLRGDTNTTNNPVCYDYRILILAGELKIMLPNGFIVSPVDSRYNQDIGIGSCSYSRESIKPSPESGFEGYGQQNTRNS